MIASMKPVIPALALMAAAISGPMLPDAFGRDAADLHRHHHGAHAGKPVGRATRTVADYRLPEIPLVRADGKPVTLAQELSHGQPVVLNFVFTTCTAICPVTSMIFAELQSKLDPSHGRVHLASISIDPQQDTPEALRAYAKKYGAGKDWKFYTGTVQASIDAQQTFNVYRGDKMNHAPVTLLRPAPGKAWIRIEGFVTADELLQELNRSAASH